MKDNWPELLAAPFSEKQIHWRAQTVVQNGNDAGKKAMAVAYIDARDVMNRLDEVIGPECWQDSYDETQSGRVICKIGVRVNSDGWVWKSDGAGSTGMEGEKGGISDAFKRAAVKWGIGRYLYGLPIVWVGCDSYLNKQTNKWVWKKWTENPWSYVKGQKGKVDPSDESGADSVVTTKGRRTKADDDKLLTNLRNLYKLVKEARSLEEYDLLVIENAQVIGDAQAFLPKEHEKYAEMATTKIGELKLQELSDDV